MSQEIEFVKERILSQFKSQNADAGHALNARGFNLNEMSRWNPKQKDALNDAVDALISEGLVDNRNEALFLTEKGVDYLYPDIGDSVRNAILAYFAKSNARAGHVFNAKSFMLTQVSNWNPKEKKGIDSAVSSLIEEGLVEERNGSIFLTDKGYDAIY